MNYYLKHNKKRAYIMKRFKGKIKDLKGKRYGDLSNDIKEKLLY